MRYQNEEEALAVCRAISPDNVDAPEGMHIETRVEGESVEISVSYTGGLEKLIVAVDDILWCMQISEKTLKALESTKL